MSEQSVGKSNDDLMQMILISLLKLSLEYGGKGIQADCEYNGVKYRLVFAVKEKFNDIAETL